MLNLLFANFTKTDDALVLLLSLGTPPTLHVSMKACSIAKHSY